MLPERHSLELPRYKADTAITLPNIQMSLASRELFYGIIEE